VGVCLTSVGVDVKSIGRSGPVKRSFLSALSCSRLVFVCPEFQRVRVSIGWQCVVGVITKRVCAASSNRIASKRVWSRTACECQAKGMRNQCRSGGGGVMSTGVLVAVVVPGPGPDTDDRQQWLQSAREQYERRKRCRTATRSVSQADVANGLANRSGRAVYLSETRSDVRSSGARSRLREWLGRAGRVKMCSRREEDTNGEVGASAWRRRGYLRKTDDKTDKRVYQFN
jgi:hypothetical protein